MATVANLNRARRGAAWLDRHLGRGWRRRILRRRLDMRAGYYRPNIKGDCGCILAQLDVSYSSGGDEPGCYLRGLEMVGLHHPSLTPARLGFEVVSDSSYEDLTDAWLEVLREGT
jgi:hypothetical protein